jgi:hypothetical protein
LQKDISYKELNEADQARAALTMDDATWRHRSQSGTLEGGFALKGVPIKGGKSDKDISASRERLKKTYMLERNYRQSQIFFEAKTQEAAYPAYIACLTSLVPGLSLAAREVLGDRIVVSARYKPGDKDIYQKKVVFQTDDATIQGPSEFGFQTTFEGDVDLRRPATGQPVSVRAHVIELAGPQQGQIQKPKVILIPTPPKVFVRESVQADWSVARHNIGVNAGREGKGVNQWAKSGQQCWDAKGNDFIIEAQATNRRPQVVVNSQLELNGPIVSELGDKACIEVGCVRIDYRNCTFTVDLSVRLDKFVGWREIQ